MTRSSDDNTLSMFMKQRPCDRSNNLSKVRKANFVIFVVSPFSVLQIMENVDTLASDTLVKLFSFPYLSFKGINSHEFLCFFCYLTGNNCI